ncbi:MAG: tetratricopeptide repeat protein [Pseudomonadota bacterium]
MKPEFSLPHLSVFSLVAGAFFIWMLVDAILRRAPFYWYLILLLLGPLGAFLYFVTVKLPDMNGRRTAAPSTSSVRSPSLDDLGEQARQVPSEQNKLIYADALAGAQRFSEAAGRYRDVLRLSSDSKEALHGLARASLSLGRPQDAIEELAHLMELDPAYRDYSAALDYAEALWQAGQHEDAIGLLTGLVSVSKRINHRMALAHYLKEQGDSATARSELDQALREFASSPDFVQRRDQRWAERARKLLAELN